MVECQEWLLVISSQFFSMNSIILIGDADRSNTYISDFIQSHAIMPYYIDRFSETLKIAHVRELTRKLSVKLGRSESRLFIIEGDITIEAQNALLKVFEESPVWAFFIVCVSSAQDVLPTISSRCQLVFLSPQNQMDEVNNEFGAFSQNSYQLLYSVFEKYQFFSTLPDLEAFILAFRVYVNDTISHQKFFSHLLIHRYVNICEQYSLIKSNNINRRTAVEVGILSVKK